MNKGEKIMKHFGDKAVHIVLDDVNEPTLIYDINDGDNLFLYVSEFGDPSNKAVINIKTIANIYVH